ncbi:MAG TPA: fatty acyl-AMP ligase [Kofleriaceae bacterium]
MLASSLVDVLRTRAAAQPDRQAFGWWGDRGGIESSITYAALDDKARAIGAALQAKAAPRARALLLYAPGFDYVAAFYGCLYGNVIAVPAYPPEPTRLDRTLPRLRAIIADAQATVVLTSSAILAFVAPVLALAPELAALSWIATDPLTDASSWSPPDLSEADLAFLQYTSGSTGAPKGVMLSHANLLENSEVIRRAHEYHEHTRMVAWVPPYHDMGLIGSIIQPVYAGFPCTLMSPMTFLRKPLSWLQAITQIRATSSGAPNFAFDLCARKVTAEQRHKLDLSSWDVAYCGSESVRRDTLERFTQTFASCGFRRSALYPCYGLAEATLIATGATKGTGYTVNRAGGVSCGHTITGGTLAIVDPDRHTRCGIGTVGEIWLRSTSIASGYWNRPDETTQTFAAQIEGEAGTWLRTGDLGLIQHGELYVTGRLKELIIVRGLKHSPSDLEATIEQTQWHTPHFRPGGSAAFSADAAGEERLFVVVEVERRQRERRAGNARSVERRRGADRRARPFAYRPGVEALSFDPARVVGELRNAIAAQHGVEVAGVFLTRPGAIPKTSSGKKQRILCRSLFLADANQDLLHAWLTDSIQPAPQIEVA